MSKNFWKVPGVFEEVVCLVGFQKLQWVLEEVLEEIQLSKNSQSTQTVSSGAWGVLRCPWHRSIGACINSWSTWEVLEVLEKVQGILHKVSEVLKEVPGSLEEVPVVFEKVSRVSGGSTGTWGWSWNFWEVPGVFEEVLWILRWVPRASQKCSYEKSWRH